MFQLLARSPRASSAWGDCAAADVEALVSLAVARRPVLIFPFRVVRPGSAMRCRLPRARRAWRIVRPADAGGEAPYRLGVGDGGLCPFKAVCCQHLAGKHMHPPRGITGALHFGVGSAGRRNAG